MEKTIQPKIGGPPQYQGTISLDRTVSVNMTMQSTKVSEQIFRNDWKDKNFVVYGVPCVNSFINEAWCTIHPILRKSKIRKFMGNRFDCKRLVERNEIFSNAFKIPNNTYTSGGISYNQNVNSTPYKGYCKFLGWKKDI